MASKAQAGEGTQGEKFKQAARDLGADESEAAFDANLKKVAGHQPAETRTTASKPKRATKGK